MRKFPEILPSLKSPAQFEEPRPARGAPPPQSGEPGYPPSDVSAGSCRAELTSLGSAESGKKARDDRDKSPHSQMFSLAWFSRSQCDQDSTGLSSSQPGFSASYLPQSNWKTLPFVRGTYTDNTNKTRVLMKMRPDLQVKHNFVL